MGLEFLSGPGGKMKRASVPGAPKKLRHNKAWPLRELTGKRACKRAGAGWRYVYTAAVTALQHCKHWVILRSEPLQNRYKAVTGSYTQELVHTSQAPQELEETNVVFYPAMVESEAAHRSFTLLLLRTGQLCGARVMIKCRLSRTDALYTELIVWALSKHKDIRVAGKFGSADEGLLGIPRHCPDVILMDLACRA